MFSSVPCHHGMVRHRVVDGGTACSFGGLGGVAANILNKQLRTNDKGWSSSWGLGVGLTTLRRKKINVLRKSLKSLGPGRILWINDPGDGIRNEIWIMECKEFV
jgi:hypothetical protein